MIINYTYKEPADRPIEKAEFESSHGTPITIGIAAGEVYIKVLESSGSFNKQDFADFTALVNRINHQINGSRSGCGGAAE